MTVTGCAQFARTALHEFGHIVGMFHAESPGALMRSGEISNCEITPMDAVAAASLYQSRAE